MAIAKEEIQEMEYDDSTYGKCNKRLSDEERFEIINKKIKTEISDSQFPVLSEVKTEPEINSEVFIKEENLKPDKLVDHGENDYNTISNTVLTSGNLSNLYKCSNCNFTDASISKVQQHLLTTHEMRQLALKCPFCDYIQTDRDILSLHCKNKHANMTVDIKYKCAQCDYQNSDYSEIQRHFYEVHVSKLKNRIKCGYCDFYADETKVVSTHFRKFHASKIEQLSNYIQYNSSANNQKTSKEHVNRLENEKPEKLPVPLLECGLCKCIYRTTEEYYKHGDTAHSENELKAAIFRCPFCNSSHDSYAVIMEHINIYHKSKFSASSIKTRENIDKNFEVSGCSVKTDTEEHKTKLKDFSCEFCNVILKSNMELQQHLFNHETKVPLRKCPMCSFKGSFKSLYDHFDEEHGDNYIYTCTTCGHKAIQEAALALHMKVIHKIKY
ncbi:hypothetical protein HHI36_015543 [Cryptolaemus montrouzieri]|uniref:C2H2-type domain-containing protein n=1 Tax=Cryptolaemus montrouzieri TaxID=559131 RepID=A0ABD2N771_9CUCU